MDLTPPPYFTSAAARAPDFTRRNYALRELLDEPCTFADYRAAMHSLARLNRLTLGYRPVFAFLKTLIAHQPVRHEPLHITDIGCGHGDLLRHIHRWAKRRSLPVKLTGIDLHPYAARLARECDRHELISARTIRWQTANALTLPAEPPPDILLNSLMAHHLPDHDIPALLDLCQTARLGWQILDLRRSQRAAQSFTVLATLLRAHPMVRHDGATSFQRAFSLPEWQSHLDQSGTSATLTDLGLGRLAIQSRQRHAKRSRKRTQTATRSGVEASSSSPSTPPKYRVSAPGLPTPAWRVRSPKSHLSAHS